MSKKPENPDIFMKLYCERFIADTWVEPNSVVGAYIRAIGFYWMKKCEGLPDDDDALRKWCMCHRDLEWEQVKPIVFGVYFKQDEETGLWHQKRARAEWKDAQSRMERFSIRGKKGALGKWHRAPKQGPPPRR